MSHPSRRRPIVNTLYLTITSVKHAYYISPA